MTTRVGTTAAASTGRTPATRTCGTSAPSAHKWRRRAFASWHHLSKPSPSALGATIEGAAMTAKGDLHDTVDSLSEHDAGLLLRAIERHDPVLFALVTAPLDDEPLTDED